ncbi:hypothetical protein QBC42DRAFT_264160 [Cladorrhinum samala]|uniref:Cyanovirin-N domain-containing protein n=1 Tax=Cladorrhinum samala TaxID=585594 RepID=A0AAV9HW49_9PEZI|nr:hypothetical protein QBC42DRAFT_264160 [Cladorrhinum samala]
MKFTLPLVTAALFATSASAGFFASCKPNWTIFDNKLTAECRQINGAYRKTQMDMNLCVANDNGRLVGRDNGNYLRSCYSCAQGGLRIVDAPYNSFLQCMCVSSSGKEAPTEVDLDPFLQNVDGYLSCYGHRGAPV